MDADAVWQPGFPQHLHSFCVHSPSPRYLTLHPGLQWWNRENHKEIHEKTHKCGKVAASTVREKRRWMLFLYYTVSKPRSDNVGLLTLQKRRFVLLLFTTVPCCHPSQCLWATLGKPPKHFLPQFSLSTELSFPSPPLDQPGRGTQPQRCANVVAQPSGQSRLTSPRSEPWQASSRLPEVSQADLSKAT